MPRYDYVSMGFYTYDCLGWPFTEVPPGGGTVFIDELTLAVSGAGGTAALDVLHLLGDADLALGHAAGHLVIDLVVVHPGALGPFHHRPPPSGPDGPPRLPDGRLRGFKQQEVFEFNE